MPTAGLCGVRERVRNAHCRPPRGQWTGEKCPLQASSANHSPCGQAEITSAIHIHRNNLEGIFQVLSSITNGDLTLNHGATLFSHAVIHKIGVIRPPLLSRLGGHGDLERSCRREQRCAGPSVAPPRDAPHSPSPCRPSSSQGRRLPLLLCRTPANRWAERFHIRQSQDGSDPISRVKKLSCPNSN